MQEKPLCVMDTIHLRTKEPLTYYIQEMFAQKVKGQRLGLLPWFPAPPAAVLNSFNPFDCKTNPCKRRSRAGRPSRIHWWKAAETLETARRRSPFTDARAGVLVLLWIMVFRELQSGCSTWSCYSLMTPMTPHSSSPHQKEGQTGVTHQENRVHSSLMPSVGSGF